MFLKSTLSFFLVLCLVPVFGQLIFNNRNDLLTERDMHSAVPVAIADMNRDGLDDIVTLQEGLDLFIQYQTPDPSRPFVRYEPSAHVDNNAQNDISIADFNNDGYNDILAVGSYDRVKIFYAVPNTYEYNLVHLVVQPFFSQGASTGDFNGDGWIDAVILNDNGLNYSLMNDGAGNLSHETFFDFVTVPTSDNSGNYGSVYTDFDMDGDNDFYIAKCRQGVNNPNDPRRINALFVNDGQNNYTQDAANYGLANGRQTWTADFGDIDNDGDMDCFMTQHDVISELYENINNDTFINITASAGLEIGGIPLQGMFRDFDNDGFQDILVSGDRIDYYHNNGDKTFTKEEAFGTVVFGTYAMGDFNNDGFTDVYASRVIPFNNPDLLREDILFLNPGNEHNFISLNLTRLESTDAIGTVVTLHGAWGTQVRDVRGGEQYGVSNSHQVIFGLGNETTYDSLVIRWPDGSREKYTDLPVSMHLNINQGGCVTEYPRIGPELEVLCDNDSIILYAGTFNNSLVWSTGETSDSIVIKQEGLYYLTYVDENDCMVTSFPVEVIKDPDTIKPVITYVGDSVLCHGEIATLTVSEGLGYSWSNGSANQVVDVLEAGNYFAEVQGYCKSQFSDTISIGFLVPDVPVTVGDTFKTGESALLTASGDSIVWYDSSGLLIGTGPVLILDGLTDTTTVFAQNLGVLEGQNYSVGQVQQLGSSKYNAAFVNGGLVFTVAEAIVLEEFTVVTDSAGTRIFEISDGDNFFQSLPVDLEVGETQVVWGLEIPAGDYTISTNVDTNMLEFGSSSPWLWRSSEGVLFPYEVEGVMSITSSTFGEDFYYYFYDWKIKTADRFCGSDLVPVTALLDLKVNVEEPVSFGIQLNPNPTNDVVIIQLDQSGDGLIEIMNMNGQVFKTNIIQNDLTHYTIDLGSMPAGMYLARIQLNKGTITQRFIKL